jgi:hypothetical protein
VQQARADARAFVVRRSRQHRSPRSNTRRTSTDYVSHPGTDHVTIIRSEDLDRLPQIVDTLRGIMAAARRPSSGLLCVDAMKRYERDMDDIEADDDRENDTEETCRKRAAGR